MWTVINIAGDEVFAHGRGPHKAVVDASDLERVEIDLPGSGDGQATCQWCGNDVWPDGDGWAASNGERICFNDEDTHAEVPHLAPVPAFSWANSASIVFDDKEEAIKLMVSVGDPRGAFVFEVRQVDGKLYIHTPYPGEPMPHQETERVSDGTMVVK